MRLHAARKPKGKRWLYCRLCDIEVLATKRPQHEAEEPHASLARRFKMDAALDRAIPYRCGGYDRFMYPGSARLDNLLYDTARVARSDRGVSPATH